MLALQRYFLRFSRHKRFGRSISFSEFASAARDLMELVRVSKPTAVVTLVTSEVGDFDECPSVSVSAKEAAAELMSRRSYFLDQLTREVWDRVLTIQLTIKDPSDPESFMIVLSWERLFGRQKVMFYYAQCIGKDLKDQIEQMFKRPSIGYSIGDGWKS